MASSSAALARKKFQQQFTASGNFTVPAGVTEVFLTMVGGGGSGSVSIATYPNDSGKYNTQTAHRGGSGFYLVDTSAVVVPGAVIPVVIGAGGAAVSSVSSVNGLDGGTSSFGSIAVKGGAGGRRSERINNSDTTPPSVSLTDGGIAYKTWDGLTEAIKRGAYPPASVSLDMASASSPSSVLNTAIFPRFGDYGAGGRAAMYNSNTGSDAGTQTSGAGQPGFVLVEWYL